MGRSQYLIAIVLIVCTLLSGCAMVGPEFEPPSKETVVPDQWSEADNPNVSTQTEEIARWWSVFNDPVLDELIRTAFEQNLSLQIAGIRILETRAHLAVVTGKLYPQKQEFSGGAYNFQLSKNATNFEFLSDSFQIYQMGFDAAWELDFWGRYRRGIESVQADLMASVANYDSVLVSLTAEVARTYILIRTFEERLAHALENVEIQKRSLSIAEAQFKGGAVSELDVQQAKAVLNDTLALIPELETGLRQARNSLSILLGMPPGGIDARLGSMGQIPIVPGTIAVGIPADLLRRRPDIQQAELQAAAQSAKIGVAKADLFPAIALTGTIGLSIFDDSNTDNSVGDFFDSDSLSYQYGIGFRWPILNYGRIKNAVRVQDARLQQLLVNYHNTVLKAASEVEDALVAFLRAQERTRLLAESVKAYKRALDLSLIQYREGLVDYQRVLDNLRFLTRQQDILTETSGRVAINLIAAYKAMGGGWQIRQGKEVIDPDNIQQMRERTNWGGLTDMEDLPVQPNTEE